MHQILSASMYASVDPKDDMKWAFLKTRMSLHMARKSGV